MNRNPSQAESEVASQKTAFDRDGFLVLPRFFGDDVVDEVQRAVDLVKLARPLNVVVDDLETGARSVLGLLSPDAVRRGRVKINDLYLQQPEMRDLALAENLVAILRALLGFTPALCNSLYFEKGSSQPLHIDTLYMTPRTPLHLIAAWVALEDAHMDAGQLEYFPRSHLIEPMRFSDGGYHANDNEMAAWRDYIGTAVARAKLRKLAFSAKKGDVFIWHANLLHGGGAINDPTLTRRSCVFHYYTEPDARAGGDALASHAGGFWLDRPPQALPHEIARQLPFSEEAYLARYPDVAAAVKDGSFASGRMHFEIFGRGEGRLPA